MLYFDKEDLNYFIGHCVTLHAVHYILYTIQYNLKITIISTHTISVLGTFSSAPDKVKLKVYGQIFPLQLILALLH